MSKKAITLLIEAHGDEDLDIKVNVPRVNLLSFSGKPGVLGDFGMLNDQSLELFILRLLRNLYKDKSTAKQQETVYYGNNKLPDRLRALYEAAGKRYPEGGFVRTYPVRQRTFYFSPNKHEDCRRCKRVKKLVKYTDGTMGPNPVYSKVCIPNRKLTSRDCPVYGLIVVSSSDPDDKEFTLEGREGDEIGELSSSNLHMNNGAQVHWSQKINKLLFPKASLAFKHMIENRNISLTQLSKIFEAMGYTDIYILDPSCRDVKQNKDTPLEKVQAGAQVIGIGRFELSRHNQGGVADNVTYARPIVPLEAPQPEDIDETTDMEVSESCLLLDAACLVSGATAAHKASGLGISPVFAAGLGTSAGIAARDAGEYLKKDRKGRTLSCRIADGVCVLLSSAAGFGSQKFLGAPAALASQVGTTAGLGARKLINDKLGFGGRKSRKNRKQKKNKKTKRRNSNKTRKYK
jgi:hypothetical protein